MRTSSRSREPVERSGPLIAMLAVVSGCSAGMDGELDEPTSEISQAFTTTGSTWPGGGFTIRANLDSLRTNLSGLSLANDQHEFWVTYALSNWKERTGANLNLGYAGTTTDGCITNNATNGVAAQNTCLEPGCTTWAQTVWWYSGSTTVQADVCVYGPSATWRVDSNSFPSGSKDLVGVLVHEFGHALGLGHTANTVMDSPTFNLGNTLARYPYGEDISGIRALYGTRSLARKWAEYNAGWGGTSNVGGVTQMHTNAAIGYGPSGWMVVNAQLDASGTAVHFTRAAYPLSSSSTWVNRFVSTNSWRPPAVAARNGSPALWVAAWTGVESTLTCPSMTVLASGDVFDSGTLVSLGDCSAHDPGLVYDPISGRFVLIYTAQKSGASQAQNGRLFARTSTDGINWTSAQDLGIYTIDSPNMACPYSGTGGCVLAYAGGGSDPWETTTQFTVNAATGAIGLGGSGWVYARTQRTPAVGTRYNGSTGEFTANLQWSSAPNDLVRGVGGLWSSRSTVAPFTSWTWEGLGQTTEHRASFGGSPSAARFYAFTAQ